MVNPLPNKRTKKNEAIRPLDMNAVRAHFLLRGRTLADFAREHGVNSVLVHRAVLGLRSGPKHRNIRRLLEEAMR